MSILTQQESSPLMQESLRPLLTVSTASTPVLNTLQRLYIFTHESWFTLLPEARRPLNPLLRKVGRDHYEAFQKFV